MASAHLYRVSRGGAGAGSALGPDAGEGALLADPRGRRENGPRTVFCPCSLLEPHLQGLALRRFRQDILYCCGEVFLKASCACASDFGCFGRTERRRKPKPASCLPTVRSCISTPKRASIARCRSSGASALPRPPPGQDPRAPSAPVQLSARRSTAATARPSGGPTAPPALRRCSSVRSSGKLTPGQFPYPPHRAASAGPCRRSRRRSCGPPRPAPARAPTCAAPPSHPSPSPLPSEARAPKGPSV